MTSLNLKTKLVFLFLAIGLVPTTFISFYAYHKVSESTESDAYEKLGAINSQKRTKVENFYKLVKNQISLQSQEKMTIDAMRTFSRVFANVKNEEVYDSDQIAQFRKNVEAFYYSKYLEEYRNQNKRDVDVTEMTAGLSDGAIILQNLYIAENKNPLGQKHQLFDAGDELNYTKAHKRYHSKFKHFLETYGYYDIFLVDVNTKDIVYSVYKELDFATSLKDGPYSNTSFAKAVEGASKINRPGEVYLADFQIYRPSYDAPASFVASPIFHGTKKVGILVFQIPISKINTILGNRKGLGKTGQTYLIGSDNRMRSNSFFEDGLSVAESFRLGEKGKVKSDAISRGLAGETGNQMDIGKMGNDVIKSYSPVTFGPFNWAIISEISTEEAFTTALQIRNWFIGFGAAVLCIMTVLGFFFGSKVATPILKVSTTLANQTNSVNRISKDISKSSQKLANSTTQQSSAIEETVSSMEEMAAMLTQTETNADSGLKTSETSQQEISKAQEVVSEMVNAMDDIQQSNSKLEHIVKTISDIKQRTQVINDIVSETRLLSFNASIEAARAGVHGKGFAVVAEEVGNLALMSGKAAEEIRTLLENSTNEVESVVASTKDKVAHGREVSKNCKDAFEALNDSLNKITSSILMINSASKEQTAGVKQTNSAMNEMEVITQENSKNSDGLAQKASELEVDAAGLNAAVEDLKAIILGDTTGSYQPPSSSSGGGLSFLEGLKKKKAPATSGSVQVPGNSAPQATTGHSADVVDLDFSKNDNGPKSSSGGSRWSS